MTRKPVAMRTWRPWNTSQDEYRGDEIDKILRSSPPAGEIEYSDETLETIEKAKDSINKGTKASGNRWIKALELLLQKLNSEVQILEDKKLELKWGIDSEIQSLTEDKNVLSSEVGELDTLLWKLRMQSRAIAFTVALIIWSPIAYGAYTLWDWIWENDEEYQEKLEKKQIIAKKIELKLEELWWKVDFPIVFNNIEFSRKSKAISFEEREFTREDFFYILTGQYHEYEVFISFPYTNPNDVVVEFQNEKTLLKYVSKDSLEKFLNSKYTEFRRIDNNNIAANAKKEAEKIAKETAAKAALDKIESDRITKIDKRKAWVKSVIQELSENTEYELGDDFIMKVELSNETIELYFSPERRLWSLRNDKQWENDTETLKLFLDPVKSGILWDNTSDLSRHWNPTNKSHIEISVQEPHDMHIHFVYPGDKQDYNQQGFDTQDLSEFWRDIVLELQWEAEVSERKEAKVSQNKQAVHEILKRLSGNDSLEINDSFDIVTTNWEHEIQFLLQPRKWNGSLPSENDWLNTEYSYILEWVSMTSDSLNMYWLTKFYIYINLQKPHNISYSIENKRFRPQDRKGYSSNEFNQLFWDIYKYFSKDSQLKSDQE